MLAYSMNQETVHLGSHSNFYPRIKPYNTKTRETWETRISDVE